jgi:hypothetical protein
MFVLCLLYKDGSMERKVTWRTKKDLNSTKMDQRGKPPDRQKKKKKSHRGHGCLSLVSVVCCHVEVSATNWSLVQRSPTDCGVSQILHTKYILIYLLLFTTLRNVCNDLTIDKTSHPERPEISATRWEPQFSHGSVFFIKWQYKVKTLTQGAIYSSVLGFLIVSWHLMKGTRSS